MHKPLIAAVCLLLACLAAPSAQSAWTVRHPLPTLVQFEGVAWTGKLYVAVGYKNTIVTSPDGIDWTLRQSDTGGIWHTVVWTGEFLLAIGSNYACMTSPDGI